MMIRCAGSFGGEVAFVDFDDNVVGRSSIGHGCTVRLESLLFGCKKIKKVQGGQKGGKLSRQNPLRGNWFLRFSQTCFVYGAFFKNTFKKKRSARGGAKINSLLISGLLQLPNLGKLGGGGEIYLDICFGGEGKIEEASELAIGEALVFRFLKR